MPTIDLTDGELAEMDDDLAVHLPTVRMAREIRRRRSAERTVPPAIQAGIDRYAKHGIAPGACLRAILDGNLYQAFARADPDTTAAMPAIIAAITSRLPSTVWGSPEAVSRYVEDVAQWVQGKVQ